MAGSFDPPPPPPPGLQQLLEPMHYRVNFQKLNKILISQDRFIDYIIIFRSTKFSKAQIADLRLCALMSCALLSAPLCRVSE